MSKHILYLFAYFILSCFLIGCNNSGNVTNSPTTDSNFSIQSSQNKLIASIPPGYSYALILPAELRNNNNTVFAGQNFSFIIFPTRTYPNESYLIFFENSPENPNIKYNPPACEITQGHSDCFVTVEIAPDTPTTSTQSYTTNIKTSTFLIESIHFGVESPLLIVSHQPNPEHVALQGQTSIGISLYSVPTYKTSGTIMVTLSTTTPNIISIPTSCTIDYANGAITTNTCANIPITGINNGRTSIIASSPNFKDTVSHFITVGTEINYTYVTNMNSNNLSIYDSTLNNGLLTPLNSPTQITENSPNWTAFDPSGRFAYVTNALDNTVSMFKVEANGALTPLNPPTIATGSYPVTLTFEPTGRFAYVTNQNSNNISLYKCDQTTGLLTPLSPAPSIVAAGKSPVSVTADPSGQYLYVTNYQSNNISMFKISQITSYLTPLSWPTVQTNGDPYELVFDPAGKYAYAPNSRGNSISVYSFDQNSGILTLKANIQNEDTKPDEIRFAPQGTYAYVTNQMSGSISMYSVNPDTGMLNPLIPYRIQNGGGPVGLTFDATGQYVYVTNSNANTISMYSFNPNTGILSSLATPIASGQLPIAISIN